MSLPSFFNNLTQLATRPMTVQRSEWASNSWWRFAHMRTACIPYDGGERVLYVDADDLKKSTQFEAEKIMTREGWNRHLELYERGKNNFIAIEQEINLLIDNKKEILVIFKKWVELLNMWGVFGFSPFAIEGFIDPKFRELLKKMMSASDAENIITAISSPSQINAYQEMQVAILDAAIVGDTKKAKQLVKKWSWYSEYSFVEPLLDEKYFVSEIKKIDKYKAKEEKEKIFNEIKKNKKLYKLVLNKLKNDKIRLYAEILHTYTFLRTDRIDIYKKGQSEMRKVYDLIAKLLSKKTNEQWERIHVVNLLNREIIDFLKNEIIPDKKSIDQRINSDYIYFFDKGKAEIITDSKAIFEAHKLIHRDAKKGITGAVAFKGKASGPVVLIKNKGDLTRVKAGNILVARITMPDYTPAMKLAVAFITEEGGITSHAAIIARELKKPCIVGTGNCTKILKDGDFVEVDADKGIVKILK